MPIKCPYWCLELNARLHETQTVWAVGLQIAVHRHYQERGQLLYLQPGSFMHLEKTVQQLECV